MSVLDEYNGALPDFFFSIPEPFLPSGIVAESDAAAIAGSTRWREGYVIFLAFPFCMTDLNTHTHAHTNSARA